MATETLDDRALFSFIRRSIEITPDMDSLETIHEMVARVAVGEIQVETDSTSFASLAYYHGLAVAWKTEAGCRLGHSCEDYKRLFVDFNVTLFFAYAFIVSFRNSYVFSDFP